MEEEIIDFLKKVGAISRESGKTFAELMEATGRNYDTVWVHLKIMLDRQKAEVSDRSRLRMQSPMRHDLSYTKTWREENHLPLVVWLGPVIREEMDKRKREDDLLAAMQAVAAKPAQVIGNQFNGPATDVITGPVVQQVGSLDSPIDQRVETRSADQGSALSRFWKRYGLPLIITVAGGLLVLIFWEQIKTYFEP